MPFPSPQEVGWAPAQVTNGGFSPSQQPTIAQLVAAGLIDPSRLPTELQQQASQSANPVDAFIASLPPEVDRNNPTAILQAAGGNPSMQQAVIERFGIQNAGGMTFENPYRHPLSEALVTGAKDVLIPYGAAMGAIALTGAGAGGAAGGAASGAGGGAASTFPLPAAGGAITATPIAAGAGTATVAGSTAAAGVAGANALTGAAGFADKWLPTITGGVNALLGARAADKATDAETAAYQAAIDEQRRQYDSDVTRMQPWVDSGTDALGKLNDPATSFQASPGYAWARNEGVRDIGNSFSARGGAQSGNALKALAEWQTGLAQQDYGNWWNQQSQRAGLGQNAVNNVTNIGQNTSANVSNALTGQGVSRASGVMGKYGSLAQGINGGVSNWLYRRRLN